MTARRVIRIDARTGERKPYNSLADAARENYCSRGCITHHCAGRRLKPMAGRYRFVYEGDIK